MNYVLDASVVGAWYLRSQATRRADELLAGAAAHRWPAPHCFGYEVPNLLLVAERRGQIVRNDADRILRQLTTVLQVEVLAAPAAEDVAMAIGVARTHGLSLFDGLYLLTALALDIPLASRGKALLKATLDRGGSVYDATPDPADA